MYGASLTSTFNFCDTFWQISVMGLLNFNLQSKFMLNSFSLRELFVCKSSILSVLGSWLFKKWYQLSVFRVFVFPGPRPWPWPRPPICIYRPWPLIFVYRPWPQSVFTGPGLRFLLTCLEFVFTFLA